MIKNCIYIEYDEDGNKIVELNYDNEGNIISN